MSFHEITELFRIAKISVDFMKFHVTMRNSRWSGVETMAVRKVKGTTVYPPPPVRSRIEGIASSDPDGASFNYYAVKFMRWGLARYDRMQAKKQRKLQAN